MDTYRWKRKGRSRNGVSPTYLWILLFLTAGIPVRIETTLAEQAPSAFQQLEVGVAPSPNDAHILDLPLGERLTDFAVSPLGPEVAILTRSAAGSAHVLLWKIASGDTQSVWESDRRFTPRAIAWHPVVRTLFLLGPSGSESLILRLDGGVVRWKQVTIFHNRHSLSRLIVGPRPFEPEEPQAALLYRLFFAVRRGNGTSLIASVTERGERYYEVTQAKGVGAPAALGANEAPPQPFVAESAAPEAFHPAGHILLWADRAQCFQAAHYGRDNWEKSAPVWAGRICGGSIEPTPNGIGLFRWRRGTPGVQMYLSGQEQPTQTATQYDFVSVPIPGSSGSRVLEGPRATSGLGGRGPLPFSPWSQGNSRAPTGRSYFWRWRGTSRPLIPSAILDRTCTRLVRTASLLAGGARRWPGRYSTRVYCRARTASYALCIAAIRF